MNKVNILARRYEIQSLAKDLSRFQHIVYLSREEIPPIFSPAYFSYKPIFDRNWYNTAAIFLIKFRSGVSSKDIQLNMSRIKTMGGLVCSITDGVSWGWANVFTDYSFVMPPKSELEDYYFTLKLLRHYMRIK